MRLYVAGPMSGYPDHNFPAFRYAARRLRAMGHEVVSPVEMDESDGFDPSGEDVVPGSGQWAAFLSRDVKVVADPRIEGIVVIDGWEQSRGAALEVHVARELGKTIYRIDADHFHGEWDYSLEEVKAPTEYRPPANERPLEEALRLVHGDRGQDYGHPGEDFARTAGMWASLFGWSVTPAQVALAMICVKMSRLIQTPDKRDSAVDVGGYIEAYWMVMERAASLPVAPSP